MNKIITLSAAIIAACSMSFAGNVINLPANHSDFSARATRQQTVKIDNQAQKTITSPIALDREAPAVFNGQTVKASFKNGRLQSTAGTGLYPAFYQPVNFLKTGIFYNEEDKTFGYNYSNSIILGQAFTSYFEPLTTVDSWSCGNLTADDLVNYGFLDSDNNFMVSPFGVPGAYYCPTIATGSSTYTYGDAGLGSRNGMSYPQNSYFYTSDGESMPVGAYDLWCGGRFYSGYTNTPAYGSYYLEHTPWDIDDTTGDTTFCNVNSNTLIIDLGYIPGFVVEKLHLSGSPYDQEAPLMNGATLTFALIDYDENGVDSTCVYNGTITAEDFAVDDGGWWTAVASFTEEDEDGFTADISPVIRNSAQLIITGFYQDGVDFGIPMMYSADNNDETDFPTHSYYDLIVDGKQLLDEEGDPVFTGDEYTDAVVNLYGHFTFIGGSENGEKTFEGWIDDTSTFETADGVNYTLAYSALGENGTTYKDFDIYSSFGVDYITAEYDEEKIFGVQADSTYYGQYGVYMLFVGVTDKLQPGETTSIKVYSNDEDYMTINITNRIGQGIKEVAIEEKKEGKNSVYNLQGVLVSKSEEELAPGVYVKNGKKFVK